VSGTVVGSDVGIEVEVVGTEVETVGTGVEVVDIEVEVEVVGTEVVVEVEVEDGAPVLAVG